MEKYRLAHLSDLHLRGPSDKLRQRRVLRLVKNVIDSGVDHILLGGDLVDDGNIEDAAPLIGLLKKAGYFCSKRLSVVPGNHDIWPFSGEHSVSEAISSGLRDLGAILSFRDWPAQQRYEEFLQAFAPAFKGTMRDFEDRLPCVKEVGPLMVGMLDSTSYKGYHQSARGRFDPDEGEFLTECLGAHPGPTLVLMHHVPWDLGLFDIGVEVDDLPAPVKAMTSAMGIDLERIGDANFTDLAGVRRFIRRGKFDAVLCGHLHLWSDEPCGPGYFNKIGSVPAYCMGRSGAMHQEERHERFAWHEIEVTGSAVKVDTRFVRGKDLD